jgi:hypothetical protein
LQNMEPFLAKLGTLPDDAFPDKNDKIHPWSFLRTYKSPVKESQLEKLSPKGEKDAKVRFCAVSSSV